MPFVVVETKGGTSPEVAEYHKVFLFLLNWPLLRKRKKKKEKKHFLVNYDVLEEGERVGGRF